MTSIVLDKDYMNTAYFKVNRNLMKWVHDWKQPHQKTFLPDSSKRGVRSLAHMTTKLLGSQPYHARAIQDIFCTEWRARNQVLMMASRISRHQIS